MRHFALRTGWILTTVAATALFTGCGRNYSEHVTHNVQLQPQSRPQSQPSSPNPKQPPAQQLSPSAKIKNANLQNLTIKLNLLTNYSLLRRGTPPNQSPLLSEAWANVYRGDTRRLSQLIHGYKSYESKNCQRFLGIYQRINQAFLKSYDHWVSSVNPNAKMVLESRLQLLQMHETALAAMVANDWDGGTFAEPSSFYCRLADRSDFKWQVVKIDHDLDSLVTSRFGIPSVSQFSAELARLANYNVKDAKQTMRSDLVTYGIEFAISIAAYQWSMVRVAKLLVARRLTGFGLFASRMGFASAFNTTDYFAFYFLNKRIAGRDKFLDYRDRATDHQWDLVCGQAENFLKLRELSPGAYVELLLKVQQAESEELHTMVHQYGSYIAGTIKRFGSLDHALSAYTDRINELNAQKNAGPMALADPLHESKSIGTNGP